VAIGDKDVPVCSDRDSDRTIKGIGTITRNASPSQGHQHLSVRAEFYHLVSFPILSVGIGSPDIAIFIHQN
jgi:hypothetical protein